MFGKVAKVLKMLVFPQFLGACVGWHILGLFGFGRFRCFCGSYVFFFCSGFAFVCFGFVCVLFCCWIVVGVVLVFFFFFLGGGGCVFVLVFCFFLFLFFWVCLFIFLFGGLRVR